MKSSSLRRHRFPPIWIDSFSCLCRIILRMNSYCNFWYRHRSLTFYFNWWSLRITILICRRLTVSLSRSFLLPDFTSFKTYIPTFWCPRQIKSSIQYYISFVSLRHCRFVKNDISGLAFLSSPFLFVMNILNALATALSSFIDTLMLPSNDFLSPLDSAACNHSSPLPD